MVSPVHLQQSWKCTGGFPKRKTVFQHPVSFHDWREGTLYKYQTFNPSLDPSSGRLAGFPFALPYPQSKPQIRRPERNQSPREPMLQLGTPPILLPTSGPPVTADKRTCAIATTGRHPTLSNMTYGMERALLRLHSRGGLWGGRGGFRAFQGYLKGLFGLPPPLPTPQ